MFLTVDVHKSQPWQCFEELRDPELMRLAEMLPETILQCRATSTYDKVVAGCIQALEAMGNEAPADSIPCERA